MTRFGFVPVLLLATLSAIGQGAAPSERQAPISYASVTQLNTLLGNVDQASQSCIADLGRLRIDRWKTDSNNKRQTQADVDSLLRNLQSALPAMANELRVVPEDVAVTFKLYHNLDALHDVLRSVAETAGAFAPRDEFQPLANDANAIDTVRRQLADRLQNLATNKEAELARLRTELKAAQAAPPPPPKKILVDDTEPAKKTSKKKTSPKTAKPPASQQSQQAPQTPQ